MHGSEGGEAKAFPTPIGDCDNLNPSPKARDPLKPALKILG